MAEHSHLRDLLEEDDEAVREKLYDFDNNWEKTDLLKAVHRLGCSMDALICQTSKLKPIPQKTTSDHVKEMTELHIKQWMESLHKMSGELNKIEMRYEREQPKNLEQEKIKDLQKAIARQELLLDHSRQVLDDRTDEYFGNPHNP